MPRTATNFPSLPSIVELLSELTVRTSVCVSLSGDNDLSLVSAGDWHFDDR